MSNQAANEFALNVYMNEVPRLEALLELIEAIPDHLRTMKPHPTLLKAAAYIKANTAKKTLAQIVTKVRTIENALGKYPAIEVFLKRRIEALNSLKAEECRICYETNCEGFVRPCKHAVHRACLDEWTSSAPNRLKCPGCTTPITFYTNLLTTETGPLAQYVEPEPVEEEWGMWVNGVFFNNWEDIQNAWAAPVEEAEALAVRQLEEEEEQERFLNQMEAEMREEREAEEQARAEAEAQEERDIDEGR